MGTELSFRTFLYWVIAGMGVRVGWGLIQLLIDLLARAIGHG